MAAPFNIETYFLKLVILCVFSLHLDFNLVLLPELASLHQTSSLINTKFEVSKALFHFYNVSVSVTKFVMWLARDL